MRGFNVIAIALAVCGCDLKPAPMSPMSVTPARGAAFTGTYSTTAGSITLQQAGSEVVGTFTSEGTTGTIKGAVSGLQLTGTAAFPGGRSTSFVAFMTKGGLSVSTEGGAAVVFPPGQPPPVKPVTPPTKIVPSNELAPEPKLTGATGQLFRDELDGWEIRTPDGWKYTARGTGVYFTSDSQPGVIVVGFVRGMTADEVERKLTSMIPVLGAVQTGAPRAVKTKGGQAVIIELGGALSDGRDIRTRAFLIAGERGVVAVVGFTAPQNLERLRSRLDELAMSARFFPASVNPSMAALSGAWQRAQPDRNVELCSDGSFFDSSFSDSPSRALPRADAAYFATLLHAWTGRVPVGRWSATGSDAEGTLRLSFNNGTAAEHRFQKRAARVDLDGQRFASTPAKLCK